MPNQQESLIALPGGEWLKPLQTTIQRAGIGWVQQSERNYLVELPEINLQGVIVRTKDVPRIVERENSPVIAGFTGNDVLIQSRTREFTDQLDWPVPLSTSSAQSASVYLGYTPNAYERFGTEPSLDQILEGVHRHSIS